jgi:hypothetical protein
MLNCTYLPNYKYYVPSVVACNVYEFSILTECAAPGGDVEDQQ